MNEIEQYFKDNNIDIKDIRNLKLLMQQNNDLLEGGLRSNNSKSSRNLCIFNAQDSLDATYPMYLHFNIVPETIKIVSVKLSFWLQAFRAYDKSAASGGGATSGSGGGQTSSAGGAQTSSTTTTPSGGGSTSGAGGSQTTSNAPWNFQTIQVGIISDYVRDTGTGLYILNFTGLSALLSHQHTVSNHYHSTPAHTHPAHSHTVANHTHTIADHTHTTPAHTHDITFGIYEETNSPTIGFQISRDNGKTYGAVLGQYTADVVNLEIYDYVTDIGSYIIKFTSTTRARISAQLTCKLDIKSR